MLEEFGLGRDGGSYDPNSAATYRNLFYEAMFDEIYSSASNGGAGAGDNFWAWAGQDRPLEPYGSFWSPGDPWIGDPPHEHQGWYSVYDADTSTLNTISNHANDMYSLNPIPGDLEPDGDVDMVDFTMFAEQWRKTNCGTCGGADLDDDSDVDTEDLNEFTDNWLSTF